MKARSAVAIVACVLLSGRAANAHRIDEYLQATILSLESNRIEASMRLIPGILVAASFITAIDTNGDGIFSPDEEHAYAQRALGDLSIKMDGRSVQPRLISWSFPQPTQMRDGLGEIHIEYTADLPLGGANRTLILTNLHQGPTSVYLVNVTVPRDPNIRILAQKRNEQQSVYELDYLQTGSSVVSPASWAGMTAWLSEMQFSSLFHLGMRHIAEGTDHLLFLLTLLLPAPLLVSGKRWGVPADVGPSLLRITGIVTAFTIGHSITLTLAALGSVHVPSRPIEVLIAVSILFSALHALRPIVPGKESLIAGFFGLIHGLAFASTLDRLGLGRWERVGGILSFNLGIEVMQMLVVAAILPSLILMSRTRAYPLFRIGGAAFAIVASLGWIVERSLNIETHVDTIVNTFARHAPSIAVALFLTSIACRLMLPLAAKRESRPNLTSGLLILSTMSSISDR